MWIFDKFKDMMNPDSVYKDQGGYQDGQDPNDDGQYYEDGYDDGFGPQQPYDYQPQPQQQMQPVQRQPVPVGGGSSLELKVVKPDRFEQVQQISEHLLARKTVVLNLEDTNKETARRLIDFLSGVAFAIDGQLKRVANSTFVITPKNVDVSGEQLREEAAQPRTPTGMY